MKVRRILFCAALALLAILSWYLWARHLSRVRAGFGDKSPEARSQDSASAESSSAQGTTTAGSTNQSEHEYSLWFLKEVRRDPDYEWKVPINFWGKVIDEDGQPIGGADVEFTWTDASPAGTTKTRAKSDPTGLFRLVNRKGKHLSVIVSKSGFHQVPEHFFRSLEYAAPYERFHPDPKKPVVFRLRRMGEFVELHSRLVQLEIPNNGPELILDWLNDQISPTGYFHCQIEIKPENRSTSYFSWRFRMSIPDGGFIPVAADSLPFEAPEMGYEDSIEIVRDAESSDYQKPWITQYYVAFGSPRRYGRIKLDLSPYRKEYYQTSNLFLSYWINPTGSRNLEGDPKQGLLNVPFKQLQK